MSAVASVGGQCIRLFEMIPQQPKRCYLIVAACIAAYAATYFSFLSSTSPAVVERAQLSSEQLAFLHSQQDAIEQLGDEEMFLGGWLLLGSGASKRTFEHPDFPGWVVKVINRRSRVEGNPLERHHSSLLKARQLLDSHPEFDQITLPTSYLYTLGDEEIVVESKISLMTDPLPFSSEMVSALSQFYAFARLAEICDVNPLERKNSVILPTSPPKIALFDLDCKKEWD